MLDLDGTTVPNSPTAMPSKRVLEAIEKAKQKVYVCVVTGRLLSYAEPVLDVLKLSTPVVLLGGCQIWDAASRTFIQQNEIEEGDFEKVIKDLIPYKKPIKIYESNTEITYDPSYVPNKPISIYITKLTDAIADEIVSKLSAIPTISSHKVISWTHGELCVTIAHAKATKQHAVFEVAKLLGIETHQMIAIGDGPNDFPMLMAAGLKVAMGNASADLKAIADYIAPTVDEDGVVDVIEKFVLKK
jgi:HAD superfamily hydrolase (TIGR01484 family)